jgi:hypothetical protein
VQTAVYPIEVAVLEELEVVLPVVRVAVAVAVVVQSLALIGLDPEMAVEQLLPPIVGSHSLPAVQRRARRDFL